MESKVTLLYGSQTGNAEDMAKRIGLQFKRRGCKNLQVMAIDDFQLKLLPKQKFVLFVCATTGHGQEPENMKNFFNFIRRRDLPHDCLNEVNFAVFGLGSSSYAKFNYVSKILFKRLKECGAKPVQELVASDEQHHLGCDGLIYPKLDELCSKLRLETIENQYQVDDRTKLNTNSYSVIFYDKNEDVPAIADKFNEKFKSKYTIREARCIKNERLTPESHFQDTRLLCFKALGKLQYQPGDVCTIYPQNLDHNVGEFIELLNLDPKQRFKIEKIDHNYMIDYLYDFIPDGLEVQDLVRYYLDIQSVPKRSFFEYLWPFSDDELERNKLKELASTDGQAELYDYCIRPKRTILETLLDFPKTTQNIKFEYLLDLIPPIKPRSFSIASSADMHENEIHLLVGIVKYKTIMRKERQGLCSNYLAKMEVVDNPMIVDVEKGILRFFIRKTSFKLPKSHEHPIIMVGPGLGLSPFRSFIEQRAHQVVDDSADCDMKEEKSFLYFGCRYQDRDYYFREELEEYVRKSVIRLRVAFSRQDPKQYVQDLLSKDSSLIRKLILEKDAIVYVAGNSKLPEELRTMLGNILSSIPDGPAGDPESIVASLEADNRIQYDCW